MNNRKLKLFILLIISIGFNYLSVLLAPFASPDDLGQLAFIMFIFFPASAVITGILTKRMAVGLWTAPVISILAVSLVILTRYNSSGLKYAPAYGAIALIGYLLSWSFELIIRKFKR